MSPNRSRRLRRKKTAKTIRKTRDNVSTTQYAYGGGLVNQGTGAGTSLDKNYLSFFNPSRLYSKTTNEVLYVESWAAAKFIDIPIDDMFVRWREFEEMENRSVELIKQAELDFDIPQKLSKSMKAGNLYGTGLFVIMTKEAPPDKPLNISRLQPGDLSNILTVDRFDATVVSKNKNVYSKNYNKPIAYQINLKSGGSLIVHHSRVLRFDGITATTDTGWQAYDQDWGIPSITPVIIEIFQDSNVSKGIAHLVNEASIPVQKIEGFEEAVSGEGDESSLSDRMAEVTACRNIYQTVFMDKEDDFERHDVTFAGLPDLLDKNSARLAAAANIPLTRFAGTSAVGMNATGEGDAKNYALKVGADQQKRLPVPLDLIDSVLKKHIGLNEEIKYKFPSLIDMSDGEKSDILSKKAQALVHLVTAQIITEDEAREALDGDAFIGNLDDLASGMFETDTEADKAFKNALANKQATPEIIKPIDSFFDKVFNKIKRK